MFNHLCHELFVLSWFQQCAAAKQNRTVSLEEMLVVEAFPLHFYWMCLLLLGGAATCTSAQTAVSLYTLRTV
jgi:hypothetical protein